VSPRRAAGWATAVVGGVIVGVVVVGLLLVWQPWLFVATFGPALVGGTWWMLYDALRQR
jgi:hypothetical protein